MTDGPNIKSGRLAKDEIEANFLDIKPPLDRRAAAIEANRCYFCFDAPCVQACPTCIDIPSFIRKIDTGNVRGSALDILDANIFGGMCARVCPTEILCEEACVRNGPAQEPVKIGQLQRYSTDALYGEVNHPFVRGGGVWQARCRCRRGPGRTVLRPPTVAIGPRSYDL